MNGKVKQTITPEPFPSLGLSQPPVQDRNPPESQPRMTLREYYAGQALASMAAAGYSDAHNTDACAQLCVQLADALVAELAR
jgi:hypothetical protein